MVKHSRSRSARRYRARGGSFLGLSFSKDKFKESGLGKAWGKTTSSISRARDNMKDKWAEHKRLGDLKKNALQTALEADRRQKDIMRARQTLGVGGGKRSRRSKSHRKSHRKSRRSHKRSRSH